MPDNRRNQFFARLRESLDQHFPAEAATLYDLAEQVFDLTPLEEFVDDSTADICGFIHELYGFLLNFEGESPAIRCFNPSLEHDGWQHRHTQVLVLQRDMAFLVDSLRRALASRGLGIHSLNSTVLNVERDGQGRLLRTLREASPQSRKEALIYFQVDRFSDSRAQHDLVAELEALLFQIRVVNEDYQPALEKLSALINSVRLNHAHLSEDTLAENLAFLSWVKENHFTFLAYSYYRISDDADPLIVLDENSQLGLFRINSREIPPARVSSLAPGFRQFYQSDSLLTLAKSSIRSRIHRDAYCEYVIVKAFADDGRLVGEHRFLGLYTSLVYAQSPFTIPLIRQKLFKVYDRSGLSPTSHDGKALRQIMEVHPREELFHASEDELYDILIGIWQIQERRQVKLFLRADPFEKFVSCIVYFPRDTYRTEVREQAEALLMEALQASECQFNTYFTESLLVRTHFMLHITSDHYRDVDLAALEQRINVLTHDWRDSLRDALKEHWGDEKGLGLAIEYRDVFPASYREHFDPRVAVQDLELVLSLDSENRLAMCLYQPAGAEANVVRLKVFHAGSELLLSSMVPMLENLGFVVIGEHPYELVAREGHKTWLHEFNLRFSLDIAVDVPGVRSNFQDAFEAVWLGLAENDSFNWLVVGARLDWRSVALIRLYARYMKQLGSPLSQEFIARTLCQHLEITRNLVALFKSLFDPRLGSDDSDKGERARRLETRIREALDGVANLNEDQVLRGYLQLICATVRTNFFQSDQNGDCKPYISVKLMPRSLPMVPEPRPEYEVFVYSPRVEGVHLRAGKVARGGIRWSDRQEDYRTEILGLVKAQQVKNAVIVPTGAKGGFVARQLPIAEGRDAVQAEAVACYRLFISGLLDITDNLVDGAVVPPQDVVRHDGDDAYLVVAADKGTASFSDIANALAAKYGYWLGDAFASGGSNGYDHKKMGITARGAWVAVQRHFRERGVDVQNQAFTAVGIGDMSGDVFGNGMLQSPHTRLLAAFNHQSIFIDPDPEPGTAFAERQRLFALPRSSWDDYNADLISEGGGVYSRAAKRIELSVQARAALGIETQTMTPTQLVQALLQAPVDLIWNGGIGTYVKSSLESHQAVGDRANDELRVDGRDLRCRVFGEGGNLGMTQRGRIEFALAGGACNTDFIDNVGGVDCSDQEVNIKILLNQLVASEDLTHKQRNELLLNMTDDVAAIVLRHSYRQTQGISLAEMKCRESVAEFMHSMADWVGAGELDRKLENLPDDEVMADRQRTGKSLTRPELSVLLSHAKIIAKRGLVSSPAIDDAALQTVLGKVFPGRIIERWMSRIAAHPLRREIIANYLANDIIDRMGISFFHRQMRSTGAEAGQVVRAYSIMRDVLDLDMVWAEVEALDHRQPFEKQAVLQLKLMRLGRRTTRWLIRNRRGAVDIDEQVRLLKPLLQEMFNASIDSYGHNAAEDVEEISEYLGLGLSHYAAVLLDSSNDLFFAFGMADVALKTGLDVELVSQIYALLEEKLSMDWLTRQIGALQHQTRWEDFAREAYVDELEHLYRSMAQALLTGVRSGEDVVVRLADWESQYGRVLERWSTMIRELRAAPQTGYAMFSVALRELLDVVESARQSAPGQP